MMRFECSWRRRAIFSAALSVTMAAIGLTGCASVGFQRVGAGEAPTVIGPPVRDNFTPMNPALACLANELSQSNQPKLTIAVDDIKDYTGKYDINEGNAITQGGALMVMSALGKLGGQVNIADRFNTNVAQMELSFMNQRELGDGAQHTVGTGAATKDVPWLPYYGGSIIGSQYYITGGITELNYNVQSGGAQFEVDEIGPSVRVFTESVALDLEIVDTKTLLVVKTVSLEKQVTGYEVDGNIFQFFGSNLFDLDIGNKSQEPVQLAIRSTLEEGVLDLVSAVANVPPAPCLAQAKGWISTKSMAQLRAAESSAPAVAPVVTPVPTPVAAATPAGAGDVSGGLVTDGAPGTPATGMPATGMPATGVPKVAAAGTLNAQSSAPPLQNGMMQKPGGGLEVKFDYGATDISGGSIAQIDEAAQSAKQSPVQLVMVASAGENWAPSKRQQLLNARLASVKKSLQIRGVLNVTVAWEPSATQTGITMDDSGYQEIAVLIVG